MLEFSLKKIRYLNIVIIAFIVVSSLVIIRFIVDISFSKKEPYSASIDGRQARKAVKGMNIMQFSPVLEKNPFGKPMKLQPIGVSKKTGTTVAGPTEISDLLLIGTVVGPRYISYAVFQEKNKAGKQDIFSYGDQIFDYGILTKIERSAVEIQKDDLSYSLQIDYEKLSDRPGKKSVRSMSRKRSTSRGAFAKKIGEREYLLDRSKLQKSIENPEKVLTDARLLPNIINGRQEGFKISEVVPNGLYHSLGLRNGDILLNINGLEISNPEVAIQAMSALKGMNRINLDIMRSGENMSMDYQIR
jgi:general secretion pathway protein C